MVVREVADVVLLLLEGVYGLLGCKDFREMEQGAQRLGQQAVCRLLEAVLAEVDKELCSKRDTKNLRMVHLKSRSLMTTLGEVRLNRRYYRDCRTGEGKFLLDEMLGLGQGQRLSPGAEELMVRTAVDLPYHRGAALLEELTQGRLAVTPMAVWHATQRAGQNAARLAGERRVGLFERGEVPPGQRQAARLAVEADELVVRSRDSKQRWLGIKLAIAYEGKAKAGTDRRALVNRQVLTGVMRANTFWQEAVAEMGHKWDLAHSCPVTLGGDGASWIKQGRAYLPRAIYRLDRYHLRRALREAVGSNHEMYGEICEAIASGEWQLVDRVFQVRERMSRGKQRDRLRELRGYLRNNWEGIRHSDEAQVLGAMEGQVFHHLARRMKRHGARWSRSGADHLGRLLAARANGELVHRSARPKASAALPRPAIKTPDIRRLQKDPAEWLRRSMPALQGPHASKPWVKWVLREISRIQAPA
ncbi:MAG: ISLre2 family transposase [bacterium]|nr:ISLre2 family transposase [bacterium]